MMSIYDGIGLINYYKLVIPYKQSNGIIVSVQGRESSDGEIDFIALKGVALPFDISKLKNK